MNLRGPGAGSRGEGTLAAEHVGLRLDRRPDCGAVYTPFLWLTRDRHAQPNVKLPCKFYLQGL